MGAGVRQTLKLDELAHLPIPIPSLEDQHRISDYLDRETAEIDAMESMWAQNEEPSLGPVMTPDRRSYHTMVDAFARGTFDAGLQSGIVHSRRLAEAAPEQYATEHPVLVAAGFTIADDTQLQWLERYAAVGGHLIVGIRTGYEDEEQRARLERKPAHLTTAAGIWYDEFSNLQNPLPLVPGAGAAAAGFFDLPADARATLWADGVQVEDAEVLVHYDHPHFGQWAAATTRVHGAGRVTYVGTVPNPALAAALMDWAVDIGSGTPSWRPNSPTQSVHSATNRHGETVHVIHNWAWEPSSYTIPSSARDVLSGEEFTEGAILQLGAWDVRVVAVA